jgi:valyl-tRNA synthetase
MSKSKGNVLDPIDIIDGISADDLVAKRTSGLMKPTDAPKIEKATRKEFPEGIPAFGADALRFTFASLATHGRDIKFDLQRCEGYKNFCNKLWNAARFALMNCEGFSASGKPQPKTDAERWILDRLQHTLREVEAGYADYRFDLASQALYEFAWNEFCDWFVELAKPALAGSDAEAADSTRHTLLHVLESLLRLLHPLTPFVTEELWRNVAPKLGIADASICTRRYPQAADFGAEGYAPAEADIEWFKAVVSAVRSIRSTLGISPSKQVSLLFRSGNVDDATRVAKFSAQLKFLLKLESIAIISAGDEPPPAAPAVVGDLQLFVPLEGLVDLDAERARLDKEITKVSVEKDKSEAKLAKFGGNVPPAVVEQERVRLAEWTAKLDALQAQRARLG